MGEFQTDPQEQFERAISAHEGVNSRQLPWLLNENQLADAENVVVDRLGRIQRRQGTSALGGRPELPGGIGSYVEPDGDKRFSGVWGQSLYRSAGDAGWAQIATNASLTAGLLHDFVSTRVDFNLALAVAAAEQDGASTRTQLHIYDIVADAVTGASMYPRCMLAFQNRLFVGDRQTLHWSELGQPASYSNANNLLIEPGIGGEITALFAVRDEVPRLVIFKNRMTLVFSPRWGSSSAFIPTAGDALDTINSEIKVLNDNIGCVATRSVVSVPGSEDGDVFFLAPDGVRALRRSATDSQTGAGQPISYNIPDWVSRINFSAAHRAVGSFFDNAYHLAVPMDGSVTNTHILRYSIATRGWTLFQLGCRDLRTADVQGDERLFLQSHLRTNDTSVTSAVGDATLPHQMYRVFSGDIDPGNNKIDWKILSKGFALESLDRLKRWSSFAFNLASTDTAVIHVSVRNSFAAEDTRATLAISADVGSIVLGVTPLPWQAASDSIKQITRQIDDVDPGFIIQLAMGSVTGSSDNGRISVYLQQVGGFVGPKPGFDTI